jgi:hypothetical protein
MLVFTAYLLPEAAPDVKLIPPRALLPMLAL